MPSPWSATTTSAPSAPLRTVTSTALPAGENDTAFSTSSATISVRSPMMSGSTMTSVPACSRTRWKPSIWPSAARTTLVSASGPESRTVSRMPASSIRLSALRRRRTAMWSMLYSRSSSAGSVSPRSTASISASWRVVRLLTRRPTLPNISATLRRLTTWRSSSADAVVWTWLKASARAPISSFAVTGTSRSRIGSSSSVSSSATRASSRPATSATSRAAPVRACTGRTTERRTSTAKVIQTAKRNRVRPSSRTARQAASLDAASARSAIWPMRDEVIFSRISACSR